MAEAKISVAAPSQKGDIPATSGHPVTADDKGGSLAEARAQAVGAGSLPYPPSWVDQLTDRVRRLPVPAWVFYLTLGLVLTGVIVFVAWANGFLAEDLLLLRVLSATTGIYFLALLHYLDDSAADALKRFRPVMMVGDADYERLAYQFTTMPRRPTLIASAIGLLYAIFTLATFGPTDPGILGGLVSPMQAIVVISTFLVSYTLVGVSVYHTIHQLRMVNQIYTHHTRINLFQAGPMYSLSRLAARTAIGVLIPTYLWSQVGTDASAAEGGVGIFETAFYGVMIVLTFVWPLLGAHVRLEKEKERLKDEVARRVEATIAELHRRVDSSDMQGRDALKDTLDGLVTEQGVIDKLRTWPWQTQTISGVGAAFLLPLFIWFIQRLLERLGV
ncbi:MAG: hypothetical protein M3441_12610 [Chloroflexota bacterium]|nr:hypothetical protein [Chloroflexota bacterium]